MSRNSTNKELVEILEARNTEGSYDQLIANAKANRYHDYKNPEGVVCGKIQFIVDSCEFPELEDVRNDIRNGLYDEEADEEDKAEMRKDLPESMWGFLGL